MKSLLSEKYLSGVDPIVAPSNRIWGYETNYGSFSQFTKVQPHQILPKPTHLNWAEAASYMLVGATAYRMPHGFAEHPGESTIPTSCFVCERGGMVVICAGTSGFNATADLRYHWMHQKRLQGPHFANDK